jgi:hypothetical protein
MGKKHDFMSKLLLFKTGKLYSFMLMEVGELLYWYLHSFQYFIVMLLIFLSMNYCVL